MSEKFNITVNEDSKKLMVKVKGFFNEEDGKAYKQAFDNALGKISPKQYSLELDCKNLSVTKQDLLPMLQECFQTYKNSGFKNVKVIVSKVILKIQLSKLAHNVGLDNFIVEQI